MLDSKLAMLEGLGWLAYREWRRLRYSWTGQNEFCRGSHAPNWRQNWEAVQGLVAARRDPCRTIEADGSGNRLWECRAGRFWAPEGADAHFINMLTGEILGNIYNIPGHPIGKESIAFDCGANVGFYSRYVLDKGAKLVVAFEPSPRTAECLRRNLEQEIRQGRAVVIEKGLWDRETTLGFQSSNKTNPGSHHVVEDLNEADFTIPVTSLSAAAASLGLGQIHHLKMDIEGSELRALAGGEELLRRDTPACSIATEHTGDLWANAAAVIAALRAIDRRYHYVCTEMHVYRSPSRGLQLTPYTLQFTIE